MLIPYSTKHEVSRKEMLTKVMPSCLTEKERPKRRRKHGDYNFWNINHSNSNNDAFVLTQDERFQINPNLKGGGLIEP